MAVDGEEHGARGKRRWGEKWNRNKGCLHGLGKEAFQDVKILAMPRGKSFGRRCLIASLGQITETAPVTIFLVTACPSVPSDKLNVWLAATAGVKFAGGRLKNPNNQFTAKPVQCIYCLLTILLYDWFRLSDCPRSTA